MWEKSSKKIDRMSINQIRRLFDSCLEILNFAGYHEIANPIDHFVPVDDVLYLLQQKLGILEECRPWMGDIPNEVAIDTLNNDEGEE